MGAGMNRMMAVRQIRITGQYLKIAFVPLSWKFSQMKRPRRKRRRQGIYETLAESFLSTIRRAVLQTADASPSYV